MSQPMSAAEPQLDDPSPMRAARLGLGLSLRATAAQSGISAGQLSRFERGEEGLSLGSLYRLAEVLGLTELAKWLEPYAQERTS